MKHLKKFNESFVNYSQSLLDYIKLVFIDFFENGSAESDWNNSVFWISIDLPEIEKIIPSSMKIIADVEDFIIYSDKFKELLLDIKSCINKVKDEFEEIECDIEQNSLFKILVIFKFKKD